LHTFKPSFPVCKKANGTRIEYAQAQSVLYTKKTAITALPLFSSFYTLKKQKKLYISSFFVIFLRLTLDKHPYDTV